MADTNPLPAVTLYTDGGADPNPGLGGWAAILLDPLTGKAMELSGGEPRATNNRMELTAAIRGLEALKRRCRVQLFTDSQYLRKGVTLWLPGWVARGWKRKDGELQNEDLWRRLHELIKLHDIQWDWIKGHAGNRWNERADELATLEIRKQRGQGATAAQPAEPVDAEVFLRVSCAGRRGGWAAMMRRDGEEAVLSAGLSGTTPNQLDLLGAVAALESLPPGISVAVHTGSDYLRNGASRWIEGWRRRGWKTQEGQPVQNRELWQRLDKALAGRRVTWPEVKGRQVAELEELGKTAKEAAGLGR
ncbi:MAG TPA: ribonuclease HI [Thermoanaerobaculia bacterium]|jgi:ribonuclease HI|nr:ribonuclease HI [Thermoanaerobaculia bacterium]